MVLPLIPIALAAAAGIGLEKGYSNLFGDGGDTKKDIKIGGEYHAPQEVYSPTTTYAQAYQLPDYNIAIDSPLAQVGSKKDQDVSPDISAGVSQVEGVNMTHIAIIGAVGLVLFGVVKK